MQSDASYTAVKEKLQKAEMRTLIMLLAVGLHIGPLYAAEESGASLPSRAFPEHGRICFVGDSITHGGYFHVFINLFYKTHYPNRKLSFFNAGIGGHTVSKTRKTSDWNVVSHQPDLIVLMLGMNDLRGSDRLSAYIGEMPTLLGELRHKTGADMLLLTPTPYDETTRMHDASRPLRGANGRLAAGATAVHDLGKRLNLPVIDVYTPLNELNLSMQKADPTFSLIGQDRIHPGYPGHLVMAYAFLKAQGHDGLVSSLTLLPNGNATRTENCTVRALKPTRDGALWALEVKSRALPFPVMQQARVALDWVPFQDELNRELFCVQDLPAGIYALYIDEEQVGHWDETTLAAGINLAALPQTPQLDQANEVLALLLEKQALEHQINTYMFLRYHTGKQTEAELAELHAKGGLRGAALKRYYKRYLSFKDELPDLPQKIEALSRKANSVNTPKARRYELVRLAHE